jgi:hypothetical protein
MDNCIVQGNKITVATFNIRIMCEGIVKNQNSSLLVIFSLLQADNVPQDLAKIILSDKLGASLAEKTATIFCKT